LFCDYKSILHSIGILEEIIDKLCNQMSIWPLYQVSKKNVLIAVKTHDDKLDRVVMEVLKDVTRDDLNDEAHDIHIYFKPVGPFSMYKSLVVVNQANISLVVLDTLHIE